MACPPTTHDTRGRTRALLPAAALPSLVLLASCTTVHMGDNDSPVVQRYLGLVHVHQERAAHPMGWARGFDISAVGLYFGVGSGIGWRHERQVLLPLDCRDIVWVLSGPDDTQVRTGPRLVRNPDSRGAAEPPGIQEHTR
jgi:hypothetical protein